MGTRAERRGIAVSSRGGGGGAIALICSWVSAFSPLSICMPSTRVAAAGNQHVHSLRSLISCLSAGKTSASVHRYQASKQRAQGCHTVSQVWSRAIEKDRAFELHIKHQAAQASQAADCHKVRPHSARLPHLQRQNLPQAAKAMKPGGSIQVCGKADAQLSCESLVGPSIYRMCVCESCFVSRSVMHAESKKVS